jgi:UDP-4-amino-4,6-dideoxy-N-acetyl-beta-L-altrosamine transaminase
MAFIPYSKQTISDEDIQCVVEVLQSDFLTTGPKIKAFEEAIASYCGAKYCVSVANATAGLHLISLILLQPQDKVLTTPNSFLATSNAILYANAKPIFIDIAEDGNIDLDLCEEALKKDSTIKALYGVHFSGNPLNQKKLKHLKERYGITIVEDCAHSIGASFENIKAGSCQYSDASVFSFHPVKGLTTGEGGAVTTNCQATYEKLLLLRSHGMQSRSDIAPWMYDMTALGFNYRLTDIACALGLSQLKKLNSFLYVRRSIAKRYDDYFNQSNIVSPLYTFSNNSAYHLYVVKIAFEKLKMTKKEFVLNMREKNIGLQYHYIPINQQPFYKDLGYGNEVMPVMDDYNNQAISLPIYPNLTQEEQAYVVECMKELLV